MTRLIDADALLKELNNYYGDIHKDFPVLNIISDAPTVQPEGWVSVPTKLPYNKMREVIVDYFARTSKGEVFLFDDFWKDLLAAAPTDKNETEYHGSNT